MEENITSIEESEQEEKPETSIKKKERKDNINEYLSVKEQIKCIEIVKNMSPWERLSYLRQGIGIDPTSPNFNSHFIHNLMANNPNYKHLIDYVYIYII